MVPILPLLSLVHTATTSAPDALTLDPSTLVNGGLTSTLIAAIVWFVRTASKRLDTFLTKLEEASGEMAKTLAQMQLDGEKHYARDDIVQVQLLDRLTSLETEVRTLISEIRRKDE